MPRNVHFVERQQQGQPGLVENPARIQHAAHERYERKDRWIVDYESSESEKQQDTRSDPNHRTKFKKVRSEKNGATKE